MSYTVVLEREPDGGFVASVPALPGCVTQGDSREEVLSNIREAIELYIEDCRMQGIRSLRKPAVSSLRLKSQPDAEIAGRSLRLVPAKGAGTRWFRLYPPAR